MKRKAERQLGPEDHDDVVSEIDEDEERGAKKALPALQIATTTTTEDNDSAPAANPVSATAPELGGGFEAYAKVNPFASAMSSAGGGTGFLTGAKLSDKPFWATANGGTKSVPSLNTTEGLTVEIPSPKTPRSNPFAALSPSRNPFMTIVPGKDEAFKAVASAAASPASISSTTTATSHGKPPSSFSFAPPKVIPAAASAAAEEPATSSSSSSSSSSTGFAGAAAANTGAGLAFGLTATNSKSSLKDEDGEGEGGDGEGDDPEEDRTPAVLGKTYQLAGGPIITGEEEEECLVQVRAKLYRMTPAPSSSSTSSSSSSSSSASSASSAETGITSAGGEDGASSNSNGNNNSNSNVSSSGGKAAVAHGEWVEVGVGPVRVLRHVAAPASAAVAGAGEGESEAPAPRRVRVVMRREDKKGGTGTKLLLNMALKGFSKARRLSEKTFQLTSLAPAADGSVTSCAYLFKCSQISEVDALFNAVTSAIQAHPPIVTSSSSPLPTDK